MRLRFLLLLAALLGGGEARAAEWSEPRRAPVGFDYQPAKAVFYGASQLLLAGVDPRSERLYLADPDRVVAWGPRVRGGVAAATPRTLIVSRRLERPRKRDELCVYAVSGDRIRLARRLSPRDASTDDVDVSVSADGWIAVAWSQTRGRTRRVRLATRSPAGSWSPARTLSAAGVRARDTGVAITDGGAGIVAWRRPGRVEAATFSGGTVAPAVPLGPARYGWGNLDAAIAPDGTAVVAWSRKPFSESAEDARVLLARRPAGGAFAAPVELAESGTSGPRTVMDRSGRALVVWSDLTDPPVAALVDGAGVRTHALQGPSRPERATSSDPAVAFTPAGEGVVAWSEDFGSYDSHGGSTYAGRVLASSVAADGAWRDPQVVWSSSTHSPGEVVELAAAPSGEFALTWSGATSLLARRPAP